MKFAVTIARTYGSAGKEIGKEIAKNLNIDYYSHKNLSDEHTNDYVDDEAITYSLVIKDGQIDFEAEDKVFKSQSETIRSIAAEKSCLIIGRCADFVLEDYENVVKIFITASPRDCMRRVMHLYELNPEDAKSLIHTMNKSRGEYYSYHTGRSRDNAANYDLCINVSGFEIEESAEIITDFIKKKLGI